MCVAIISDLPQLRLAELALEGWRPGRPPGNLQPLGCGEFASFGRWRICSLRSVSQLQILRGMTHAAIPRPCPLTSHRFPIDYQSIRAAYYRRTSPMSASSADSSGASGARKLIRSFVRGCSKLSFHECRKTLSSLKGDGLEGA